MTHTDVARGRRDVGDLGATAIPLVLSFIAGMADVTSFVLLNGLFAAHVTGNLVVLAADLAAHRPMRATALIAVVVFIAVTAVLAALVDRSRRSPYQWASTFMWLQFALLAATAGAAVLAPPTVRAGSGPEVVIAVLAVASMACQNALLHLTFARAPSTAVMTGNIVASTVAVVGMALMWLQAGPPSAGSRREDRSAEAASRWASDRAADREAWLVLWPLLLGFAAGCGLGALASDLVGRWAWTVPVLVSGILATVLSVRGLPDVLRRVR
ncbi:YoaK family protein [Marmoricola sp. URHB0036]|uniref:YoaK family protein n=1 Tax=Marmoricola sp. URHB0036 TaxID=1298863 RepID=UPI0004896EE3|nr:YoaK family protein [Marmoricola sp. URHB0036]